MSSSMVIVIPGNLIKTSFVDDMDLRLRCCTNYYSACRRRGGVLKCPRFCFFFLFFLGVESWAAAHGLYRCAVYRLLSEPMSTRFLNSISRRICRRNTQFNMYTTTSKQQKGCTFKDSHPKCFIMTNSTAKLSPGAVNRGDVLTDVSVIYKVKGQFEWSL